MSRKANLTITDNGATLYKMKNNNVGIKAIITAYVYGEFGGGTLTVGVSADNGSTVITDIDPNGLNAFTSNFSREYSANSDEYYPTTLVFTLSGATDPDIAVAIYDAG